MKSKYALLTVDTEALPNRASHAHVDKLMWGKHGRHQAGVREMASMAAEFGSAMIFFLDICGAYECRDEVGEVAKWLDEHGQDVQLHVHPEYLPLSFWQEHKRHKRPYYLNDYPDERAQFIITFFAEMLKSFTGKMPRAFRAGSFRWNSGVLKALKKNNITLSFNNSMCAVHNGQCPFSLPTNKPYQWSNGVIEIPVSEKKIFPFIKQGWWARLQYPQSRYFNTDPGLFSLLQGNYGKDLNLKVFLIHSWSFLHRDKEGHEIYRDDRQLSQFRPFLKKLSRDHDIITTSELLDLINEGKIALTHVENVEHARTRSK